MSSTVSKSIYIQVILTVISLAIIYSVYSTMSRREKLSDEGRRSAEAAVARYHHERYDGSGYPEGLKGEEIPTHARLVAIVDAYDAMNSDRIYRAGLSQDQIRSEIIKGRGKQFDPNYAGAFLRLLDSGRLKEADTNTSS